MPVALLLALAVSPERITGVVVDPQGLVVPSARVSLTCGLRRAATMTDELGRFIVTAESIDGCTLVVERAGFETAQRTVTQADREVLVQLSLAVVREVVQVAAPRPARSLFSPVLDEADFHRVAGNTADLIDRALALAGATALRTVVYVDGLPGGDLPALDRIARISINADTFSAEYNDGDVAAIHIVTRAPARTVHFDAGSDAIAFGGHDLLAPAASSGSSAGRIGVSAPVPHLPLTFSASVNAGRTTTALPIRQTLLQPTADIASSDAVGASTFGDAAFDLHYAAPSGTRGSVSLHDRRFKSGNVGVGGLVAEESGFATSYGALDTRAALSRAGDRVSYEAGALITATQSTQRANARTIGISVPGFFVTGGASVTASDVDRVQWLVKQVIRTQSDRPWTAGLQMARSDHRTEEQANTAGTMRFDTIDAYTAARAGEPTGTLFVTLGDVPVAYASMTVAPFVQKILLRTARFEVTGGLRGDYQQRFGTLVLPRLSAAAMWHGYAIRAGAGVFGRTIPEAVTLGAIARDGFHRNQFVASNATLTGSALTLQAMPDLIRVRLADDLARPRETMVRTSIERSVGRFVPAVEYTWSQEQHRLGADRGRADEGWLDTIASDRAGERHRVHAMTRFSWARHQISAHYEWTRARDDGDGPWSHPERSSALQDEWARSAGVAPHTVTATGSFMLPGALSLSVTDSWASGAPYNVTTGLDVAGDLLYGDRGGRPRNSGLGTPSNALSMYAYRRVAVPAARGLHVGVGVQGTNLLNNRNYTNWGAVAGTPSFGRPLGAQQGRALRLFLSVS